MTANQDRTLLHGSRMALARPLVFLLGVLLSLYGIVTNVLTIQSVLAQPELVLPNAELWTYAQLVQAQAVIGLPPNFYAIYSLIFGLLASLVFLASGWLIIWKKSQDWFGLYLGIILLGWSASSGVFASMPPLPAWIEQFELYIAWFMWPGFFLLLYFFPSGQVIPRWTRWIVAAVWIFILQGWIGTALGIQLLGFPFALPLFLTVLAVGVFGQIYRYLHAGPLERQQVKWVIAGLVLFVVNFTTVTLLVNFTPVFDPSVTPPTRALVYQLIILTSGYLSLMGLPVSIVVAILRYRLWDIDVIIRRTLVWGALTVLLGLVYFGGITFLQSIFSAISNQQSAISIVLSTLAIAALFNPLRKRVQDFVDWHFYRRKYDADQALASFTALAREEVDLEEISARLLEVVEETVQPEHVMLWLRSGTPPRERR